MAIVGALGIGLLGTNTMPFLLGAIMDGLDVGPGRAGAVGSIELGAIALMSLALAPRIGRLSLSKLALRGGIVSLVGYGLSAAAGTLPLLMAARFAVGLGGGAALAAGNAAVASSRDPDSLYAKAAIAGGLAAAVQVGLLPYVLAPYGYAGGFAALAFVVLLCLPLVRHLPSSPRSTEADASGRAPSPRLAIPLLAAIGFEATAEGALWAFSERMGLAAGLDLEGVGLALAATTVSGLCAAAVAVAVGTRRGRATPIAFGLLLATCAKVAVVFANTPLQFVVAQVFWGFGYFLTLPYVMGTAAALDSKGRWTAAAAGISTIGAGVAPGLAGVVVSNAGYPTLGMVVLGLGSAALLLAVPVALAVDRRAPPVAV